MALINPEFLQTKTYSALRDRLMFQHGGPIQAGAWDAGDFKITQRAAGANMTVDAAAGFSLVPANDPGNLGLYHLQNDASVNVTGFAASNGSLPRIDSVYVRVNDTTDGGDVSDVPAFGIATGTATAGATLDNRTGAAAIPTGSLLLADILIPAASSSIVTANIRDRRAWARGAFWAAAGPLSGDYSVSSGGATPGSGKFNARIELSGNPVRVDVQGQVANNTATTNVWLRALMDGSSVVDSGPTTAAGVNLNTFINAMGTPSPAAGSHVFDLTPWANAGGIATLRDSSGVSPVLSVREIVQPNTKNG